MASFDSTFIGPREEQLVTFSNEFDDFNPLLFIFAFMPFVGYILFWRQFTTFRKRNILGRRGKKTEAIIINKSESASRNLKWSKVLQLSMKIEYEAYDEFHQQTIIIEKTLTNISQHVYDSISEGYTVNIKYDPINPFMFDIDDEYFSDTQQARTGCCRNCGYTLLLLIIAIFMVLIPWWILNGAGIKWYWVIIIVILIPVVMIVIACVSCCVCCKNHDMIAWYKTRTIQKEQSRQYQMKQKGKKSSNKGKDYQLLGSDEFK